MGEQPLSYRQGVFSFWLPENSLIHWKIIKQKLMIDLANMLKMLNKGVYLRYSKPLSLSLQKEIAQGNIYLELKIYRSSDDINNM